MARWQYTMIFEGFGKGASEMFTIETADDSFQVAFAQVSGVREARAALLAKGWYIKGDKITMKLNTALVKQKNRAFPRDTFLPGNQAQVSISLDTALKAVWATADFGHRKLTYMCGGWEATNPEQNAFVPTDTWTTKFNSYVAKLKLAKAGWMSNLSPEATVITGYTFDAIKGKTTYTLADPIFAGPFPMKPVKVAVDFPLYRSALDGVQLVTPLTATTARTTKPRPAMPFQEEGKMRLFVYSFINLATSAADNPSGSVTITKVTRRQRGRPLLESPGRAAVRVLW